MAKSQMAWASMHLVAEYSARVSPETTFVTSHWLIRTNQVVHQYGPGCAPEFRERLDNPQNPVNHKSKISVTVLQLALGTPHSFPDHKMAPWREQHHPIGPRYRACGEVCTKI